MTTTAKNKTLSDLEWLSRLDAITYWSEDWKASSPAWDEVESEGSLPGKVFDDPFSHFATTRRNILEQDPEFEAMADEAVIEHQADVVKARLRNNEIDEVIWQTAAVESIGAGLTPMKTFMFLLAKRVTLGELTLYCSFDADDPGTVLRWVANLSDEKPQCLPFICDRRIPKHRMLRQRGISAATDVEHAVNHLIEWFLRYRYQPVQWVTSGDNKWLSRNLRPYSEVSGRRRGLLKALSRGKVA